jgi:hypothetical protein
VRIAGNLLRVIKGKAALGGRLSRLPELRFDERYQEQLGGATTSDGCWTI